MKLSTVSSNPRPMADGHVPRSVPSSFTGTYLVMAIMFMSMFMLLNAKYKDRPLHLKPKNSLSEGK